MPGACLLVVRITGVYVIAIIRLAVSQSKETSTIEITRARLLLELVRTIYLFQGFNLHTFYSFILL